MKKLESIQEFYTSRHRWIPDEIKNNIGHFNVFPLEPPHIGKEAKSLEYGRREWYNIVLVFGGGILQCSGDTFRVKDNAIVFTNPFTPFGWDERNKITKGYYCIFNEAFLKKDKRIIDFTPFKTNTTPFFELSKKEAGVAESLFKRMFDEINTDYIYKYDIAKMLVEELLHLTMKSKSFKMENKTTQSAAQRLTIQFLELLERQFPIDESQQIVKLRSASEFAEKLNVHVNHLNRAVKETAEKTTSEIIAERILQEAKILLRHSSWNVSEIAYSLGFTEPTHFNNFFKKHTKLSPMKFRVV